MPPLSARLPVNFDAIRRFTRFAIRRGAEDRVAQVAGSLTFTTVLSVVPLVTVAFALFTAFPIFSSFRGSLQGFLVDHLMPPAVNNQIFNYLNEFASKAKGLTTAGMFVLLMTSVMTMMTVESALNTIWRVRKPRPLAQRILVYWAVLTLGPVLFGISLSISSYLWTESMMSVESVFGGMPSITRWMLSLAVVPLSAVGFTLLYVYLPNCRVAWRDAVVGGVFAAVAFEATKRGFGQYIRHFPTYAAVYGAFAAIPIFLLWIYLSWLITLVGAMITSALPAIRIGQFQRPRFAGSDLLDALDLLSRLAHAHERGRGGYTTFELARRLRRELSDVERGIAALEARGWIACLEQPGGAPRWVLVASAARITVAELFDLFVLDRGELAYQLDLPSTRIDGAMLLGVLDNERLQVSLADLLAARVTARGRASAAQAALDTGPAHESAGRPRAGAAS